MAATWICLPSVGPGLQGSNKLETPDRAEERAAAEKAASQTQILGATGTPEPSRVPLKQHLCGYTLVFTPQAVC